MKSLSKYLHEIFILIGKDRRKLPVIILCFLGVSAMDLLGLGLVIPYINLVMQPDAEIAEIASRFFLLFNLNIDRETQILLIGTGLVAVFLLRALGTIGVNFIILSFAHQKQLSLQLILMKVYQQLPYLLYLKRNSAEYIHSIQGLTGSFTGVLIALLRIVSDGIIVLAILALLIFQDVYALLLLCSLLVGSLFFYDLLLRGRMKEYGRKQHPANHKVIRAIHEGLEGLKEIRILGCESHFFQSLKQGAGEFAFYNKRFSILQQVPRYLLEAILVFFVVLFVQFAFHLENGGVSMVATLGLFGVAALRLLPIANSFSGTLTTIRFNRDAIRLLYQDVKDLGQKVPKKACSDKTPEPFVSLGLHQVTYTYTDAKAPALQGLNLEIKAGESVGLIGPSGSGKTTLVDVILGLLVPQYGNLTFNGRPLEDALYQWRSQVAYLPQEIFLIDDTLRCNVALGEDNCAINDHWLQEALKQAQLQTLVEQLPEGENTLLGERGVRLSGGQRQRIALARAFYHRRNILVLDEATSALDNETEKEIVEEIKRLKGQKTLIVIAHRLSTVQHCDRIFRLENGRIVAEGTPQQMLK